VLVVLLLPDDEEVEASLPLVRGTACAVKLSPQISRT